MRIQVGDVIELKTSKGYSYVVVIFDYKKNPVYGKLVRVYNQKFDKQQSIVELENLIKGNEDYSVFVGFNNALFKKYNVRIVDNIGDCGYSYNNLPKMWWVDEIADPPQLLLVTPGKEQDGKPVDIDSLKKLRLSGLFTVNLIRLVEDIENNYLPINDLNAF